MRRSGLTFVECLVLLLVLSIGFAIIMPPGHRTRDNARRSSCQSNLKQISLSMKTYLQDYDEKFPPANMEGSGNWVSLLNEYLKSRDLFQCPSDDQAKVDTTDYFYNSRLSRKLSTTLRAPETTISVGEGLSDSPRNTTYSEFGPSWIQDPRSPARRHLEGANYAFADGHVKWFKPEVLGGKEPLHPTLLLGS